MATEYLDLDLDRVRHSELRTLSSSDGYTRLTVTLNETALHFDKVLGRGGVTRGNE